jgi:hypothetical protein
LLITNEQVQFYQSPYNIRDGGLGGDGPVGYVHENTHGVNSKLRKTVGGNCFFIMPYNAFVKFESTPQNISLSHVAQRCEYRGSIYNLYLINAQQWWNDTPLYVYDEWSAYMNGSYQQLFGKSDRNNDHSIACMLELAYYSHVATNIMPNSWKDKIKLLDFWNWMAEYSIYLSDVCIQRGMYSQNHQRWRNLLKKKLDNDTTSRYSKILPELVSRVATRRPRQILSNAFTKSLVYKTINEQTSR